MGNGGLAPHILELGTRLCHKIIGSRCFVTR